MSRCGVCGRITKVVKVVLRYESVRDITGLCGDCIWSVEFLKKSGIPCNVSKIRRKIRILQTTKMER